MKIADVVNPERKVTYGIVQPGAYDDNGVPLVRGQDYIGRWGSCSDFFLVTPELHQKYSRSVVRPGDVLLCIVGATTGSVNQVPDWLQEANITQTTARIAAKEGVALPRYLLHALDSPLGQAQVRKYVKGSAQPGLNLRDVDRFEIPLPGLEEQRELAAVVDAAGSRWASETEFLTQLRRLKSGLSSVLLSGEVRVQPDDSEAAA